MKTMEVKREVVITAKECVILTCDMCDRHAEYPKDELFEWGGAGTSSGKLEAQYSIDGEYHPKEIDLCYECATYLINNIKKGNIKRPQAVIK